MICLGKYQFWKIIILEVCFSKIFPQQIFHIEMRAKRAVKIVTTRLALISIWRICWGKIFENHISDTIICQNWYFPLHIVHLTNIWILPLSQILIEIADTASVAIWCLNCGQLQLKKAKSKYWWDEQYVLENINFDGF